MSAPRKRSELTCIKSSQKSQLVQLKPTHPRFCLHDGETAERILARLDVTAVQPNINRVLTTGVAIYLSV